MLRSVIVDDEPAARERLRDLLAESGEAGVVGEAQDAVEALDLLRRTRPDVMFLDIEMPGLSGFELLDQLAERERPELVFVTAYEQHALRAFQEHPADYLLKPFGSERLRLALQRTRQAMKGRSHGSALAMRGAEATRTERQNSPGDRIPIRQSGRVSFLEVADIDWIDAVHNQVRVHANGLSHRLRTGIGEVENRLDPEIFVRVHRSTIVNSRKVKELLVSAAGGYVLVLRSGQRLGVSRSYRERLRAALRLDAD